MQNTYAFLHCPNLHDIPVPAQTPRGHLRSAERGGPEIRQAIFVRHECGYARSYSTSDMTLAPNKDDPIAAGQYRLYEIEIECKKRRCNRTPVYTLLGNGSTECGWTPKAKPEKWNFTDNSAHCSCGQQLCFDETRRPFYLQGAKPCSNPLWGPPFDED
jgi:hypothetical protein